MAILINWDEVRRRVEGGEATRKNAERYLKLRNANADLRNRLEHYGGEALDAELDALPGCAERRERNDECGMWAARGKRCPDCPSGE